TREMSGSKYVRAVAALGVLALIAAGCSKPKSTVSSSGKTTTTENFVPVNGNEAAGTVPGDTAASGPTASNNVASSSGAKSNTKTTAASGTTGALDKNQAL